MNNRYESRCVNCHAIDAWILSPFLFGATPLDPSTYGNIKKHLGSVPKRAGEANYHIVAEKELNKIAGRSDWTPMALPKNENTNYCVSCHPLPAHVNGIFVSIAFADNNFDDHHPG